MRRTSILTAAAAALLIAPAATATWFAYGTFEPDTPFDSSGFMRQNPPGSSTNLVYFNAFPKTGGFGANGAAINPNVGLLGSRMDLPGSQSWNAMLGVWTDCNRDGYVGMAETAVREYDARLPGIDTTLCPPSTGTPNSWNGKNNYRGWVTELIPIGGIDYDINDDKRVWRDTQAMVWGDAGTPSSAWPAANNPCPTTPIRGDGRSTGGLIKTVDCRGERRLGGNSFSVVREFNEVDASLGTGLGFGDPQNMQNANHPLNQPTFGDDHSSHSAVYLQDCDAEPILATQDFPVGQDMDNMPLLRPLPSTIVNTNVGSWTVPGTMNATMESITVRPSGNASDTGPDPNSDCDYSNDPGNDFYGNIESNPAFGQAAGKRNAQWNFVFITASRGTLPATAHSAGSSGANTDLGVELLGSFCTASSCVQSQWASGTLLGYTPPVTRGTFADLSADGDETTIASAPHWTFYAYVSSETTGRGFATPGGASNYGAAQCGGATSGLHNGWNCDANAWYRLADGSPQNEPRPFARPGQSYNLRDVDCLDGTTGLGLGISPAWFGPAPCA